MNLQKRIKELSQQYFNEIVAIRRHIHQYPELSFREYETSKFISQKLTEYNIQHKTGYVKTGIIATIQGKNPTKKIIALRTDMDALPIKEEADIEFRSCNEGVMHACGHDIHAASLLGAAKILNTLKEEFEGTVVLIFQPAEESHPGGARLMIEEGILEEYKPEIIIAQHVYPELPSGYIGLKEGIYMASGDEVRLIVKGKGGHAGLPHLLTDTVLIASHIVVALQQIVSRKAFAGIPTVLSFGRFIANGATNVIPNEVKISGTFRTMNEEWRKEAKQQIKKIAQTVAEGMGATCEVEISDGYPFLVNDKSITPQVESFAKNYLGEKYVKKLDIRMTAEDFAFFSQKLPVVLYRLGVKEGNTVSGLHTSTFKANEKSIEIGMGMLAHLATSFLQKT